jgi:NADP-dependent aldehyde dehydrogenase
VFGLQGELFDKFGQALGRMMEGVAPATMLHGGICDAYHKGTARVSSVRGVKLLARSSAAADPKKTHGEALVLRTDTDGFREHPELAGEVFGPCTVLISTRSVAEMEEVARGLEGQLTATVHGTPGDLAQAASLLRLLQRKAGRLIINGFPTGVEVCPSMNHGGPYPATTDVRFTSVGTAALYRFVRPVCYQDFPSSLLPDALKEDNPLHIRRLVDGQYA